MCPFQDKSCTIATFSTPLYKYIIANTVQSLSQGISFATRTGNVPSVTDLSVPAAVWHPCQWPERCCCQNGFLARRCAYMPCLFYSHTAAISVCSLKLNCNESKKEKNLHSWLLYVLRVSWIMIMDGTACHGLWRWNIYIRGPVVLPQKYNLKKTTKKHSFFFFFDCQTVAWIIYASQKKFKPASDLWGSCLVCRERTESLFAQYYRNIQRTFFLVHQFI